MIAWFAKLLAGSFLSSWWTSFWMKRQITNAATKEAHLEDAQTIARLDVRNGELETQVQTVEKANATRDEVDAGTLPADVAARVQHQYID